MKAVNVDHNPLTYFTPRTLYDRANYLKEKACIDQAREIIHSIEHGKSDGWAYVEPVAMFSNKRLYDTNINHLKTNGFRVYEIRYDSKSPNYLRKHVVVWDKHVDFHSCVFSNCMSFYQMFKAGGKPLDWTEL